MNDPVTTNSTPRTSSRNDRDLRSTHSRPRSKDVSSLRSLVGRHGIKGFLAIVVSACFSFAPLAILAGWNWFGEKTALQSGSPTAVRVVAAGDYANLERDTPGASALLQVVCEVLDENEQRPLLRHDDPSQPASQFLNPIYVRNELIYARPAGRDDLPYGLLGHPPVSAWLTPGTYDVLVVHDSPATRSGDDFNGISYPLASVVTRCEVEAGKKLRCSIPLPHYHWGGGFPFTFRAANGKREDRDPLDSELESIVESIVANKGVLTPAGYLLEIAEPAIEHGLDHQFCAFDFAHFHSVKRVWNLEQLYALRRWLPGHAQVARERLAQWILALRIYEVLTSWYAYVAATVFGLMGTRWGTRILCRRWERTGQVMVRMQSLAAVS